MTETDRKTLTFVAALEGIASLSRSQARGIVTIDILGSHGHYLVPYTLSILSPRARDFQHEGGAHAVVDFYLSV